MRRRLFADISSHGLGHLAQAAPILEAVLRRVPDLDLTIRSALPEARLRARIQGDFRWIEGASDFGFVMHDALHIDLASTARRYRTFHADWAERVSVEAERLRQDPVDGVLTDVAYLPLAAAAQAGIPSLSMCSLNWADLFAHFFGHEPWAKPIHEDILAAYRSSRHFLRLTPAMPMGDLGNTMAIDPVAVLGRPRRAEIQARLSCPPETRCVLVAYGGFDRQLGAEAWPPLPGIHWLVPELWNLRRPDMSPLESLDLPFSDVLSSVDAVLTKPGYGMFVEAACNGVPVLYQRRSDWPEQDCLIDWLVANARCREVSAEEIDSGLLHRALVDLFSAKPINLPVPAGAEQAAERIVDSLFRSDSRSG